MPLLRKFPIHLSAGTTRSAGRVANYRVIAFLPAKVRSGCADSKTQVSRQRRRREQRAKILRDFASSSLRLSLPALEAVVCAAVGAWIGRRTKVLCAANALAANVFDPTHRPRSCRSAVGLNAPPAQVDVSYRFPGMPMIAGCLGIYMARAAMEDKAGQLAF
jgi:hypothetical protein